MTNDPQIRSRSWTVRLLRWTGFVFLLALMMLAGTALRLTRGPIVLPDWIVAQVETRLARDLAPRMLDIGTVALAYDLEDHALRLSLRNAALRSDGVALVTLPEARVALDGAALIQRQMRPRSVTVRGLALDIDRDAEGRLSLAFGQGGGGLPSTWAEALETLDAVLATPVIADLEEVTVDGVAVRFTDAITGLSQELTEGRITLLRDAGTVGLALTTRLPFGSDTARADVSLTRYMDDEAKPEAARGGAEATVELSGLSVSRLSEALPNVRALSLVRGTAEASARLTVNEDGSASPLTGRLALRDLQMTDRRDLRLDRALLAFGWDVGAGRIALSEIAASSDEVSFTAEGQVLLEEGLAGPVQVQLTLGETILDPEGVFDRRIEFEQGVIELRLTQSPLDLHIGQAMVTGPSGTARITGRLGFLPEGLQGGMRLFVPRMSVGDLTALWPSDLQPQARRWFTTNMLGGAAYDATAVVKIAPGLAPEVVASFDYKDGNFRYMRNMPPAQDTDGTAQLVDDRLTLRVDRGWVPATGPDHPDGTGQIDIAGSTFSILDTLARPPVGQLSLIARGDIGDTLVLLDNPPFRLLNRLNRTRDLVSGQTDARVFAQLPLRPGNAPADIIYRVEAALSDVASERIIPDRTLLARDLTLRAAPGEVTVAGDMTIEGIPFSGRWRQALPAPSTIPIDPTAPPQPAVPLPEPGQVTGVARVTPEGLARFGIALDALTLRGETTAEVEVTLPQGEPPRMRATSDLRGMSARMDVIGWSKGRDRSGRFAVDAILDTVPEVTQVSLDVRGLAASGQVTFRPNGGGLRRARFDRVDTGWFTGPVVFEGRGRGVAPAINIRGGQADLRRALLAVGDDADDGGSGGDEAPLEIALSRLQITEGIALTDLTAALRGTSGSFTARVNGGTAVEGVLRPEAGGAAVDVRGADGGGVLRSAGLFEDARGGSITMSLRPTGQTGVYSGALRMGNVRVRNAPALASLLQALSVVGILEQLTGEGLFFGTVESDFTLRPDDILVRRASAVGPSMSITADGTFDIGSKQMNLQGVISPIYLVNGLFGALFARRDEGLFGFTYQLTGPAEDPNVSVDPLSILTPGIFRDIFRRAPPS